MLYAERIEAIAAEMLAEAANELHGEPSVAEWLARGWGRLPEFERERWRRIAKAADRALIAALEKPPPLEEGASVSSKDWIISWRTHWLRIPRGE